MSLAIREILPAMLLTMAGAILIAVGVAEAASQPEGAAGPPALTAEQIVDRYVAACGGAEAWKKITTMTWDGHIETGPGGISKAPFILNFRRPDATRFEIMIEGQRSLRVFDGNAGWKRRLGSDGKPVTKEYTADEVSFARDAGGLDGPLFDYKAKGISVALEGVDSVDGHRTYRLGLQLPSGRKRRIGSTLRPSWCLNMIAKHATCEAAPSMSRYTIESTGLWRAWFCRR